MTAQRVLLIEDHPLVRSGLRNLITQIADLVVVGEAADGATALALWQQHLPTLVVLDIHLADCNGLDLLKRVPLQNPAPRILIISSDASAVSVAAALSLGVHGYFLKSDSVEELEKAIRAMIEGRMFLSADIVPLAIGRPLESDRTPSVTVLSPREREVLRLLASGLRTKEVAAELNITVKTAETFRRRLVGKLGLRSIADLTRYAIRQGIVHP